MFSKILKPTKKQIELFNDLKLGDVVWARMSLTQAEEASIEESHKTRPFLVLDKDDDIYAFPFTTKIRNLNFINYYTVKGKKYKLDKNSQIKLDEIHVITKNHLQNYFYKLDNTDLNRVIKRYNILKEKNIHNLEIGEFEIFPEIGDVILYNSKKYVIYQIDSNNIYLYKIIKTDNNKIKINTKSYDVIYSENLILKKTIPVHIIDFASEDQLDNIKLQKKQNSYEEKRLKKIKEELKIGRIIRFSNKDKVIIDIDNQNLYTIDLDLIYGDLQIESYPLTNKFKLKNYLNSYELKELLKCIKKEDKEKIKQLQNKPY